MIGFKDFLIQEAATHMIGQTFHVGKSGEKVKVIKVTVNPRSYQDVFVVKILTGKFKGRIANLMKNQIGRMVSDKPIGRPGRKISRSVK